MKLHATLFFLLINASLLLQAQTPWQAVTTSANLIDCYNNGLKPLQYNADLSTVSFVCRNRIGYLSSPTPVVTASDAVVVGYFAQGFPYNAQQSFVPDWDSTCVWSSNNNWARMPQGAIYNPSGNITFTNASFVACGPAASAAGIEGNWYASKSLSTFDNAASTVSNAMQYFPGAGSTGSMEPAAFSDLSFYSTTDGRMHSLAENGFHPSTQQSSQNGAMIITGTYNTNTGTMDWQSDSIICPAAYNSAGKKSMYHAPRMAWNENGTIGYVVFIGSRQGTTGSNVGWQPIIYKTANSGSSWSLLPAFDFNSTGAADLKGHLHAVTNSTISPAPVVPFFDVNEGFDIIVDAQSRLHIASLVYSSSSTNIDQLDTHPTYTNSVDNEVYSWSHTPGKRPYLYDFIVDATTTWHYGIVDSLSSEAPGTAVTEKGFPYNPFAINPADNSKAPCDARIQLSRSVNENYILFSWAESDSNSTTGQVKWNVSPDVKVRLLDTQTDEISESEINLTSPSFNPNLNVRGFAFMHYVSPRAISSPDGTIELPIVVSNNVQLNSLEPGTHFIQVPALAFTSLGHAFTSTIGTITTVTTTTVNVGIHETANEIPGITVYPNPVKDHLYITAEAGNLQNASITIENTLGQTVYKTTDATVKEINLSALPVGVYLVKFKTPSAQKVVRILKE